MNLQTERIDNHKAQLTVEVEAEQLDDAKQKAARQISRRVRIKGFRKGKAPYRLVVQYVGEAAILEEAIELLGGGIYRQALEESEIVPYGPGELEDFRIEPAPTFVFLVPLQPEVDLKDFADIRLHFEEPKVTDEEVNEVLEGIRQREAEVLDDALEIAAAGHRVTVDIHSEFSDSAEADEVDEDGHRLADESDDSEQVPRKGDDFLHRHGSVMMLDPENDPIMDGFVEALVGAERGREVEFELTVPAADRYESVVGRQVTFHVTPTKIESVQVPTLDDEFARRMGESRGDIIDNLDELRQSIRDDLEHAAFEDARDKFSEQVLQRIIEGAEIAFPQLMLEEYIDDLIDELGENLQQRGMKLDQFMRITKTSRATLREQYRERADHQLRRNLTLRELVRVHKVEISSEQVEESLNESAGLFSANEQFRHLFDTPQMRQNIANNLLSDQLTTRLFALGRGEDIEKALAEHKARMLAEREKARLRAKRAADRRKAESLAAAEAETDEMPRGAVAEIAGGGDGGTSEVEAKISEDEWKG